MRGIESIKKTTIQLICSYPVPILFVVILAVAIPLSGFSFRYLMQEILTRLGRDSFLVLSLLLPILAGMGLNFGIVLGAMACQIALIFVVSWNVTGVIGVFLTMAIALPIAILFGYFCGAVLNRAKGREMITSLILGYFMDGVYQLFVLYAIGPVVPLANQQLLLSRGFGVRNAINLSSIRQSFDKLISLRIDQISIPIFTFLIIAFFCVFIVWFKKTKLGQDMAAIGQNMTVANASGIPVMKTRLIAIIISTVLACFGQAIFLQNMGTLNTYNSHTQTGMFAVAALLIGGATVAKASIPNVFFGVILFHLMFIVSPMAGKHLIGDAQIGEFFRVFVSYGVIAVALVLHEWKRHRQAALARRRLRQA
ncbi:MAG: ABC transporter permease [Chitinivibrionales bacterium]|nr:ABC transporter permease [Chitinivibrionales bacterium]